MDVAYTDTEARRHREERNGSRPFKYVAPWCRLHPRASRHTGSFTPSSSRLDHVRHNGCRIHRHRGTEAQRRTEWITALQVRRTFVSFTSTCVKAHGFIHSKQLAVRSRSPQWMSHTPTPRHGGTEKNGMDHGPSSTSHLRVVYIHVRQGTRVHSLQAARG